MVGALNCLTLCCIFDCCVVSRNDRSPLPFVRLTVSTARLLIVVLVSFSNRLVDCCLSPISCVVCVCWVFVLTSEGKIRLEGLILISRPLCLVIFDRFIHLVGCWVGWLSSYRCRKIFIVGIEFCFSSFLVCVRKQSWGNYRGNQSHGQPNSQSPRDCRIPIPYFTYK